MTKAISRRLFLSTTAAFLGTSACADAPDRSIRPSARTGSRSAPREPASEALVRASGVSGIVGYSVVDVASGRVLEERAAAASLPPASVAKAITALYALEHLGPDHRFSTRVIATGAVTDGIVQGDVILAGGGDPTLGTEELADLVRQLRAAGVRGATGRLRVWGGSVPFTPVIDPEQPDHVGYNPTLSGLNLNFNRVHFEWTRSGGQWRTTMDARSANHRPEVRVSRMQVASRRTPIYTYSDGGDHDSWTVASGALGNGGARWLPVRKPELYAGEVFRILAAGEGITLGAPDVMRPAPQGSVVAQVSSAPLDQLVRGMLRFSTNITAELLGIAASQRRKGSINSLRASAREMSLWARSRLQMGSGTSFVDHSGLGDRSRITAGDMAKALRQVRARVPIRALMRDIPVRTENGSAAGVQVNAKTGTLNFVSALAGYATSRDGRELAFAIVVADTSRRAAIPRAQRERPQGARSYNRAAKGLQQKLLTRWGRVYGAT